jgi:hypothetical protein
MPMETKPKAFTAAEKREYVAAVIAKQAGVSPEFAAQRAAELSAEDFAAVHDAGRDGRVADARAILGL